MPFTPIHLGIGALGKAALGRRFSFAVFATAQVLMDLEPGFVMYFDLDEPLHGLSHTLPGAVVVTFITVLLYQAAQRFGPRRWVTRIGHSTLPVVIGTALVATISHVALDAMMHADMALHEELRAKLGDEAPVPSPVAICLAALFASPLVLVLRRWMERLSASGHIPPLSSINVRPPSSEA